MDETVPALAKETNEDPYRDISFHNASLRDIALRGLSFRKFSWAVLILLTLYVC
jgi:hypothetical protein